MFTKLWWQKAAERALKTAAQAYVGLLGADAANWITLGGDRVAVVLAGAALLSLATSILTTPFGDDPTDPGVV